LLNICELNARVHTGSSPHCAGLGAFPAAVFGSVRIRDDVHSSYGFPAMANSYAQAAQGAPWSAGKRRPVDQLGLISQDAVIRQQQKPTYEHNALTTRTAVTGGVLGSHPAREPV
jgi:hypothetical protein